MPDIRMPDGTVIKNVPEGITQAQLLKKLKVNGYDTTKLLTPAGATSTSEAADVVPTTGVTPTAAPAATASVAAPTAEARLQARKPLKEVEAPGIFDYFTDRQAAIKQARERTAYMQELGQRGALEDIKTQTGFFDRLGDFFSKGLLSTTANIKDTQRAIEADPVLKKQFTEEARRFAADKGVEIADATQWEDVKKDFLRNAIPFAIEGVAQSIPGMIAAAAPLPGLGISNIFGGQAREATELEGRQDVELSDLAKVAPGALAVTALDQLGLGGILAAPAKTALGRIGKAALLEGGTEAIQSAIEYANPRVVTGNAVDAGEMFEQAAIGTLVGGTMGAGIRGVGEAVTAPFRPKAEATPQGAFADSPQVQEEYLRLVATETQALRDQNPDLTQRQAFNQVVKDAGKLYDTAIVNTMLGAEGEADVDTGVDVVGGGGAGTAPDIGTTPPAPGDADVGETVGGGLERPISGVSIPDVGEGAGISPLTAAPAFDITPIMEAPTLAERTSAAQQLVSDIVLDTPELQALPKGKYTQAATQMATAASRGEQFDPVDIVYKVAGIERPAPAAPSIDEVAVAPVKNAIEAAAAPTGSTVPSLAETAAREVGITPTPPPTTAAPEVAATEEVTSSITPPTVEAPAPQLKVNPQVGEGYDAWIDRIYAPENRGPDNQVVLPDVFYRGVSEAEFQAAQDKGEFAPLAGDELYVSDNPERYVAGGAYGAKGAGYIVQFDTAGLPSKKAAARTMGGFEEDAFDAIPTDRVARVWKWDPEAQQHVLVSERAPTPALAEAAPEVLPAAATPQEVLADIESFAVTEAQDRDLDPDMFLAGVNDVRSEREPLNLFEFSEQFGFTSPGQKPVFAIEEQPVDLAYKAYKAGAQFAQDRVAEAQAAAPPAPPPPPPPPPTATGGTGGPAPRKPKVVSNGKVVVLTEAQKRTALAKAKAAREKMNRIQKRIAATNDTADILSGGIDLVKLARGEKENWALLSGAVDTLAVGRWQLILPTLSTEDIFRILKGRIPGLIESDRITRQDIPRFLSKEYGLLAEELEQISEFLKKYPKAAQALSDLEFATVAYQVDPTKATTPEEYADKFDKKTKELQTELGSVTVGDAEGKKKVEDKIARRLAEIKSVYVGVPGDERVLGWRDLGRPEFGGNKGKEIFKLIRDAHRRDLEAKYNALRDRLKETKEGKDLAEALEKLEAQFKPALDQVIYFPAMRFGPYYARVGTGANSVFKMFESRLKRNQFVRLMKARGEEVTEIGNTEDLRNNFEQVSGGPLKEVLDLFGDNPKDIGALKSQVFDLWLQTMSAGDMRKHMAPRKMRAGYSTDILKNFANFRRSSINDIKRAKFGEQLRIEISRAKDMVKDMPDREKMEVFIREIELRTLNSLTPQALGNSTINKMIELGNKAAFYQYLANPKTGVIQLTQLHIVALPILAQKYGHVNATAALAKYGFSALGGFAASPLTSVKKEDGSYTFNWEQPNLLDNPVTGMKKESDPELYEVLSEGWNEGLDLNIFLDTFANEIGGFANADPQQSSAIQELMKGRVHTAAWRGGVFVLDAMGSLMHQMERVNREATYMAALELAYRENKKKGQTHAEAKKNAIEAAVETTLAATFDFSSYNKPRILTSPVGRVAGQFYSFPYMMSSLLVRNMYTAIYAGKLEPGERVAAIEIATGTLINIFMYAGVKGIPLYGLGVGIASTLLWLASQFDDDEEEGGLSYIDKDGNIKATYNVDWWLRNVWIPKFFGKDGTAQNLFGYDDDTAATVALSVEKGPISAITDVDVANSVALDFMFFVPEEPRAKTPEGAVGEFLVNFLGGATVSTGIDYYKAIDDLMNGYTNRALEKTPKVFSNVAKANRFAEEGQLNYDRELVGMPEEFWTSDKVALQMLGFASTEASQRQEQNYEGRKITQKVKAARDKTLDKFRKLALDKHQFGFTPEVAEAHKKFMKEWGEYNRTYPTDVISIDTLYEVENNAINATLRSKATRGVPLDDKGKTPYMVDILKRRVEAEK